MEFSPPFPADCEACEVADVPAAEVVRILVEILTSNSEDVEMARPVVRAVMEELWARQQ